MLCCTAHRWDTALPHSVICNGFFNEPSLKYLFSLRDWTQVQSIVTGKSEEEKTFVWLFTFCQRSHCTSFPSHNTEPKCFHHLVLYHPKMFIRRLYFPFPLYTFLNYNWIESKLFNSAPKQYSALCSVGSWIYLDTFSQNFSTGLI